MVFACIDANKLGVFPGENQRQVWLTRADAVRLRRACPRGRVRAAITLLLSTGMRVGELLKTAPSDVRAGAIFLVNIDIG